MNYLDMNYLDMNNPFFYAIEQAGLATPISQFTCWEDYQSCWTAGGEL